MVYSSSNLWRSYNNSILIAIVVYVLSGILFGAATMTHAKMKGYGKGYFWTGFFFGVFGLIYTAGMPMSPEKRKEEIKLLAHSISDLFSYLKERK